MKKHSKWIGVVLAALLVYIFYTPQSTTPDQDAPKIALQRYGTATLKRDLSQLKASDRAMIPLLIQAARKMDRLYWLQHHGEPGPLLEHAQSPQMRLLLESNHGPWDKLNDLKPLLAGVEARPKGANFYPADMSPEEWKAFTHPHKASSYHLIQRRADGKLKAMPYRQAFAPELEETAQLLIRAAKHSSDPAFAQYLRHRARALTRDKFKTSDRAWVLLDKNPVDLIIGPIETYDDGLFGSKTAYEALLLVRDFSWDEKLKVWEEKLPSLQKRLPVPPQYRSEIPGKAAGLGAYDLWYAAGQANSGPKALALNLPNDPDIQLELGSRRLPGRSPPARRS